MEPEDIARQMAADDEFPRCEKCGAGRTFDGQNCSHHLCDRYDQHMTETIYFIMFRNLFDLFDRETWRDFAELADYRKGEGDPFYYHKYLNYFCGVLKSKGYKLKGGTYGPGAYVHATKGDDAGGSVDYLMDPPSNISVRISSQKKDEPWVHALGFTVDLDDPGWFEDMEAGFNGSKPEKYLVPDERRKRKEYLRGTSAEGSATP